MRFAFRKISRIILEAEIWLAELFCYVLDDVAAAELSLNRTLALISRREGIIGGSETNPCRSCKPVGL
ncbi:hypothetical protein D3C80_1828490 [compost metagenome]